MSLRGIATRQRALATIARVDATLAEPRDPALVERAEQAQRAWQERKAEQEAEASRRAEWERARAPAAKPSAAAEQRTGITASGVKALAAEMAPVIREYVDKRSDALEQAVGRVVGQERSKATWRATEAERRITTLEARLAKLEGKADGR